MGELLPGWRQQDLLGAAGPGLLKGGDHRAGEQQRRGEDEIWRLKDRERTEKQFSGM